MNTRFDYYQTIRHTQPDLFYSPKLQHQMHREQKQMGNTFFEQYELPFLEAARCWETAQ
jgi:hypothetical protein